MNVDDIKQIAIVGAGLMGHGIAQEFALAGYSVHIHDINLERGSMIGRPSRPKL